MVNHRAVKPFHQMPLVKTTEQTPRQTVHQLVLEMIGVDLVNSKIDVHPTILWDQGTARIPTMAVSVRAVR